LFSKTPTQRPLGFEFAFTGYVRCAGDFKEAPIHRSLQGACISHVESNTKPMVGLDSFAIHAAVPDKWRCV
jgi:hypothetical protein